MSILDSVPACVGVALTSVAISRYEGGTYWPGFFDTLDATPGQNDQPAWGEAFLNALRRFELPLFRNESRRFIAPIVAHAGIPDYCLEDYFKALDSAMRHVGANAEAVSGWAVPRVKTSLANIDVPVRDFLARGDEYSIDYLDRSMDLLIRLNRDDDPAQALLPDRVVEAAREYLEGTSSSRGVRENLAATLGHDRVTIRLDALAGEVLVTLPSLRSADVDIVWEINSDGDIARVTPHKDMGGRSIGVREATYSLRKPVKTVRVRADGLERSQELDLVDPEDPVLIFSPSGDLLAPHLPIPGGEVWALYALGSHVTDPDFADHIHHDEQPPLGWQGWRLSLVDTKGLPFVRLAATSPKHRVRNDARVTLESVQLAHAIRASGAAVHTAHPLLHIPDGIDADWRLTVVDLSTGATVFKRIYRSSSDLHDVVDPFDGYSTPVVGRFTISLRGPLGKGLSQTVAIAEGLNVNLSTAYRRITRRGLADCVATLAGADLECSQASLKFGPNQAELSTDVVGPQGSLELLVSPPSMAISLSIDDVTNGWQYRAAECATEDIARAVLTVRLPIDGLARARVVGNGGLELQVVEQTSRPSSKAELTSGFQAHFPLREISDTAVAAGSCTLEIGADDSIRVLRVQPRNIASGVIEVANTIAFTDYAGGVATTRIWSAWEPWHGPEDIAVPADGIISTPLHLTDCGPLILAIRHEDPWLPVEPPKSPPVGTSLFLTRGPGAHAEQSSVALADPNAHCVPLPIDRAWALVAMKQCTPGYLIPRNVLVGLVAELSARPTEALEALALRDHSQAERVALLATSGLLWTDVDPSDEASWPDDGTLSEVLAASPIAGALIATRHLARADSPATLPNTWAVAVKTLGEPYRSVVTGASDPAAKAGRLDATAPLAALSDGALQAVVSALGVVPSSLLDGDTRVQGSIKLFSSHSNPKIEATGKMGKSAAPRIADRFREEGAERLADAITARIPLSPHELPVGYAGALSLAIALLARMTARGHAQSREWLVPLTSYLHTLSKYAPLLLASDIVLAEAMVSALLTDEHPVFETPLLPNEES